MDGIESELPVVITPEQERDIEELKRGGNPGQLILPEGWPGEREPAEPDDAAPDERPNDSPVT